MEKALEACRGEQKMTATEASRRFSVPRRTLTDRLKNKVKDSTRGAGGSTFLTADQEKDLCNYIEYRAQRAFPLTIQNIISYAWCIDKKTGQNKFGPNGPSERWWLGFKARHPEAIKLRKPDSLDRGRALFSTVNNLRHYFQLLGKTLEDGNFIQRPQDIYNCDETVIDLNKSSQKVVVPRKMRVSHSRQVSTTEHISMHCCVSAAGYAMPPFIIYKGSFPGGNYTVGGPDGALYGRQQSGFMDGELFLKWFTRLFVPYAKPTPENPVLLLLDGHSSHCTVDIIEAARENNVMLLALAPHTTHLCQPLDVAVYKSLKVNLSKLMKLGQTLRWDLWVPKGSVSKMIRKPFEDAMSIQNIKSGFRKCGIFPFDPNAIDRGQLFRNRLIPSADVDLSLPPEDEGTNPDDAVNVPEADALAAENSVAVEDVTLNDDGTFEIPLPMINAVSQHEADDTPDISDYHFVSEVNSERENSSIVINLDNDPGNRLIIKVTTGLSDTIPEYQFGPGESIDISNEEPVCSCGVSRASSFQENPLVAAGIVSAEMADLFTPPDEKIPAGRKRPLRQQSKARVMSGDEVYNDIRRQQDALEEKQRLQAEKKAAMEERRRATAGIDIIFCISALLWYIMKFVSLL